MLGDAFARVLTETTQALVCVLDREGRILLFNDACVRATGFTREEALGQEIFGLVIPPEEAEAFRAWIMECAQRAADAAKEGGFMGFRAERVSQGEKDMLAQLGSALGVSGT